MDKFEIKSRQKYPVNYKIKKTWKTHQKNMIQKKIKYKFETMTESDEQSRNKRGKTNLEEPTP